MKQLAAPPAGAARRRFLQRLGGLSLAGLIGVPPAQAGAAEPAELPFANGLRELVADFPQKGQMILQRTRPPLLETPFEVFDHGAFTPNERFYVRWHTGVPASVDAVNFRLGIRGAVRQPLQLSLDELQRQFPAFEITAVNQCSGNSRGLFDPRVAGGQWGNGAMGNARWQGVRLKDLLDRAGVQASAVQVRFRGLDGAVLPGTPDFLKSLAIDHARDGEVMLAYSMNGEQLPLLNGFPLRLVVPGWYATYWVKMLNDIEVLDHPDDNFWMSKAYLIPDTPFASMTPGQAGVRMVPINRMVPRSFCTSVKDGQSLSRGQTLLRGIAFGGDCGVSKVMLSMDGGHWQPARLGRDFGKYSFRQWEFPLRLTAGRHQVMLKSVNTAGVAQPEQANWNTGGYMRNVVESVSLQVT
jgi:DMSO/TMAO reductase YedYZ molybdopterin-dependent catalytic subunit